jgi:hypothetical protein
MNRRTCACGATIVPADLDGWTVWLDDQPSDTNDGMFTIVGGSGTPQVAVDIRGSHRRHQCAADPVYLRDDSRTGKRPDLSREASRRAIAALHAINNAGVSLGPRASAVARLRLAHPTKSYRQLAHLAGVNRDVIIGAMRRIREHADQLNNQDRAA